jgi:hypothetical protein
MNPFHARPTRFAVLFFAASLATFAHAQDVLPPWGSLAYEAELATYVDDAFAASTLVEVGPLGVRISTTDADGGVAAVLLTWDGASLMGWTLEADGFEPAPGLEEAVLASVLAPQTPVIGLCATEGVACLDDGATELAGRAVQRVIVDRGDAGTSRLWVDVDTGLVLRSEGTFEGVTVRSEIVSIDIGEPDAARFRP